MDPSTILIIFLIVLVCMIICVWGVIFYVRWKLVRLSKKFVDGILGYIVERVRTLPATEKIMEYDKVLDRVLTERGYKGSLGEKMKQHGSKFKDENALWKAHKERNKLAHEIGYTVSNKAAESASKVYEKEIEALVGKKIT